MRPRRPLLALLLALPLGAVAAGCGASSPTVTPLSAAQVKAQLARPVASLSPAERRLEQQAGQLLPGGKDAVRQLDAQLRALRGTPVVVNLWAKYCAPCKKEMGLLQRTALTMRGKVAFLGIASRTTRGDSEAYLKTIATPYPSLLDESGEVLDSTGVDGIPKTLFYDHTGKRFVHQGPYTSVEELKADIARYAS